MRVPHPFATAAVGLRRITAFAEVSTSLAPSDNAGPAKYELAKFVVTDIRQPAAGKHCASASVDLGGPEVVGGSPEPPATSHLVCLAPR